MSIEPQLAAFRRLLRDANTGGQAKVDALVALAQRTVHLVPWPGDADGYRTLVNSQGVAALPIFSGLDELEEAASRFGWQEPNGAIPSAEVGARAALRYAVKAELAFVIIDITADHALEIGTEEYKPLLTPSARRDSSGPFAGAGKLSSSLIRAVRPTPPPFSAATGAAPTPAAGSLDAPAVPKEAFETRPGSSPAHELPPSLRPSSAPASITSSPDADPAAAITTFGGGTTVALSALGSEPADEIYDALTTVLRDYPEVEWACLLAAARGPGGPRPTVGVRIDTGFRQRVNEITNRLGATVAQVGAAFDVLLLDEPGLMRNARATGEVFYPWRKKA